MALSIGITGGIGSGKSIVCKIFKIIGIPVFEADVIAKTLINSNTEIRNGLIQLFGKTIYDSDNKINRRMLANLIFNDDLLMEKINQLIHPVVRFEFTNWLKQQNSVYVIHEAAILFESGFYKMMDYTILVSAPEEMRIERAVRRDNIQPEQVRLRMSKQWPDEEKRKLAGFELVNDNKNLLIPQILEIDNKIKTYGKIW
ncbi:MAG TPA: dephospho-CoA kinase [Draconibacterium sp.]|nr:dephospho-CoA kinase [Draconibacterium sp.]